MTIRSRYSLAIALALGLAACSPAADDAATGEDAASAPVATPSPSPVEPDGGAGDGAAVAAATAGTIPADFRGVWDNVEGTCAPASDLRLEIRGDEIEFYESLGEVTSVELDGPQSILVTLAMSGEGETWEVTNRYVLSQGGTVLTPEETGSNPQYEPIPRKRCS